MRAVQFGRLLMVAALAVSGAGCARVFGSYDVAPSGLERDEQQLRTMLGSGQAAAALDRFSAETPDDAVLRALYEGVLAYYAGDYARSAAVLDSASYAADDRVTKSISRSAFSLISNDRVLPFEPSRTERLMIPYYAALARLRLGDVSAAAVEARRLSLLLQQLQGDDADVEPTIAATLRYVAAAILEANGNREDADVAYRNAFAADSTLPQPHTSRDSATVLVVLEQGFVAHRVEQALSVMLLPEEVYAIAEGEGDDRALAAGLVAARVVQHAAYAGTRYDDDGPWRRGSLFVPAPDETPLPRKKRIECRTVAAESDPAKHASHVQNAPTSPPRERVCSEEEDDELPYLLKVAWPVYRTASRVQPAQLTVAGDTVEFHRGADVSRGVVADFERERALIVARTIARGTAKLALAKSAENRLEEKNETAGRIVGLLGNIGNVLSERADTRSWHLLPAGISIVRVTLPPGEHALRVTAAPGRSVDPGIVSAAPGSLTILSARIW